MNSCKPPPRTLRMIETIISSVQIIMMFLMLSLVALIQPKINV
jgi:hypothetical protein